MAEYIEREALLNRIRLHIKRITPIEESRDMFYHDSGMNGATTGALLEVENAPAADVAPVVHGKWMNVNSRPKTYERRCTACGGRAYFCGMGCSYKFCPNCGAIMDEVSE